MCMCICIIHYNICICVIFSLIDRRGLISSNDLPAVSDSNAADQAVTPLTLSVWNEQNRHPRGSSATAAVEPAAVAAAWGTPDEPVSSPWVTFSSVAAVSNSAAGSVSNGVASAIHRKFSC